MTIFLAALLPVSRAELHLTYPPDAQRGGSVKSNWRESLLHGSQFASGSRAVPHATAYDAVHGAFMTLPPYSKSREGEVQELGCGVRNGSHTARSRPLSETSESVERECPATSAEGAVRCASRGTYEYRPFFLFGSFEEFFTLRMAKVRIFAESEAGNESQSS